MATFDDNSFDPEENFVNQVYIHSYDQRPYWIGGSVNGNALISINFIFHIKYVVPLLKKRIVLKEKNIKVQSRHKCS